MKYDNVTLVVDDSRFLLEQHNMVLALYAARTYTNKPFVQCLRGPSGRNMLEDSPGDHAHHHGVWWGHGDVNGVDFYLEVPRPGRRYGRIEHREWLDVAEYRFVESLAWIDDTGTPMIDERRSLSITLVDEHHYTVDLDSTYSAQLDLAFGDTKESVMPSLRVAEGISAYCGGVITSSAGGVGEEQTMGRHAEWVDYSATRRAINGRRDVTEGIAVLDHPSNAGHPPKFFCRAYGPLCPWQGNYFTGPSTLPSGAAIRARHRLVVHEGDVHEADVAGKYRRYVEEVT